MLIGLNNSIFQRLAALSLVFIPHFMYDNTLLSMLQYS